jgi:hypothetical protein
MNVILKVQMPLNDVDLPWLVYAKDGEVLYTFRRDELPALLIADVMAKGGKAYWDGIAVEEKVSFHKPTCEPQTW